ncbi:MAG TPA: hypothetical protein PKK60_02115 [archaeon]|nr:hypothetical protein [archaeon]
MVLNKKNNVFDSNKFNFIDFVLPFFIIIIYFGFSLVGFKTQLDIASILLVSFGIIVIFGFWFLIIFAFLGKKFFGKKYHLWVIQFNNSKNNFLIKKVLLYLTGEVFFVFFGIVLAAILSAFFTQTNSSDLNFFIPPAYFILSVWSKLAYHFLQNYLLAFAIFGFIIGPIILALFVNINLVFILMPLSGAPLMQAVLCQFNDGLLKKEK